MANWQRELDLLPEYEQAKDGTVTIGALAKVVHDRLMALKPFSDDDLDCEREDIAEAFLDLSKDWLPVDGTESFDSLMFELYNWADISLSVGKKACWVRTF